MKLYVLPTERKCNGTCGFCITKSRKLQGKEYLEVNDLEKTLEKLDMDKIEITGGGEPLLNKNITEIIEKCSEKAHSQLYTNAALAEKTNLSNLDLLCISRTHYDDKKNYEIMGVKYNLNNIRQKGIPIKFSLLLHKSGINSVKDIKNYFAWAKQEKACKVVIRQMMPNLYTGLMPDEFVKAETLFKEFKINKFKRVEEGAEFDWDGLKVAFKYSPCDCNEQTFLHASGRLGQI